MKTWVKSVLAAIIIVLLFAAAAGEWALHHVDRYLPEAIAYIQSKTGKQVEIRHAAVSLFPLGVRLYGLGIPNPAPFPKGYFLQVPMAEAGIKLWPLLHGTVAIRKLTLKQPVIDFISDPDGLWNFQNPGTQRKNAEKTRFTLGSIAVLQIDGGKLLGSALIDPSDRPGPVVLEIDNFSARLRQVNLKKLKTAPDTTIAGHGYADAARFGDIRVKSLHTALLVAPYRLMFQKFQAKTYRGKASGDFTLDMAGKNPSFHTNLSVSGIGMPYLLREFSSGPAKMTGMMQAKLTLEGEIVHTANPLAGLSGGGTFAVRDGEFPNLNNNKSMAAMKRFRVADAAGKPVSAFSLFSGDIEIGDRRIHNRKVGLDFYGIDVEGGGSLDLANNGLNYTGAATIEKKQGFFTNIFARVFKDAEEKNGRLRFPIRLTGTLGVPEFSVTD